MIREYLHYLRAAGIPLLAGVLFLAVISCTTVHQYQRARLNDPDMQLQDHSIQEFETNFQSYREGAVGGNSGRPGAGCGCN